MPLDAARRAAYHRPSMIVHPCDADAATRARWRREGGLRAELADFLDDWDSPCPTLELMTSGSTGEPTRITAPKAALRASAAMSCRAFGLAAGQCAMLCLPLRFIAGKMMVLRALHAGMRLALAEPGSDPLAGLPQGVQVDFAPLVPLQAARALERADGAAQLGRLGTLLLGGGFVPPALEEALAGLPCRAYASYGMTETYSHIALRRLNGREHSERYRPLPGVGVSLSAEGTLCISAPALGIASLETNDLAEIGADGSFRILGRRDAVICSGGLKIRAEEVEGALHAATGLTLIAVPRPHPTLGSCVALLWEGEPADEARLRAACAALPRHHRPRLLLHAAALPRTATGKPARAACRDMAQEATLDA